MISAPQGKRFTPVTSSLRWQNLLPVCIQRSSQPFWTVIKYSKTRSALSFHTCFCRLLVRKRLACGCQGDYISATSDSASLRLPQAFHCLQKKTWQCAVVFLGTGCGMQIQSTFDASLQSCQSWCTPSCDPPNFGLDIGIRDRRNPYARGLLVYWPLALMPGKPNKGTPSKQHVSPRNE